MRNLRIKKKPSLFILVGLLSSVFLFFIYTYNLSSELTYLYSQAVVTQLGKSKRNFEKPITLIFVGDIMLDRGVEYVVEEYGNGNFNFPFLKIANYLKNADILFGNLEGPISDKGQRVGSIYSFQANLKAIEGLVFAGFDILSVANNHTFDYGKEAMEDTYLRLRKEGIDYIGGGFSETEAYSPIIREINASTDSSRDVTKIAFLAYNNLGSEYWGAKGENSGIAWLEKRRMEEEIKKAKNQADIVIVSFHYGEEYYLEPTLFQIFISRAAIDAGADLVVGHHPHVVQPIEKYKEKYIAYSLGNFVFDQGFSEQTMRGLLLKVLVKDNEIKKVNPHEIRINKFFQPTITEN